MRDDRLKEQLMSYARHGAEEASQPGAAEIYRRARRHYQRVAALSVTGVLLAVGLGVGLGLRGHGAAPTVNQPRPPVTNPAPEVPSTTATTNPRPTSTTAAGTGFTGDVPGTFVASIGGRVAVISTATGKVVRTLWGPGPDPSGTYEYAVGLSPDRKTVYFSSQAANPCAEPGVFRMPVNRGQATRIVANETAQGLIRTSADGSRLAYTASACPSTGTAEIVLRDASGALLHRWSAASAGLRSLAVSLSPDGRQLAVPVFRDLDPVGVRILDASTGASITDGRLIRAPDPGCGLVNAAFQPQTGQLAVFERCLAKDPQSGTPPRFRLAYLDPGSGRSLSRSLAFDDHTGADLHIDSMDFDQTGGYLLYAVGSADPADSQQPHPATGTWWYRAGQPIRVHDDQRIRSGSTSYRITSTTPSW
jgi:hypothetical protein